MVFRVCIKALFPLFCFLIGQGFLHAQDPLDLAFKWGYAPIENVFLWGSVEPFPGESFEVSSPGMFGIALNIDRKKWLASEFSFDISPLKTIYDNSNSIQIRHRYIYSFMHTWRFIYINKPKSRLYSGVGVGFAVGYESGGYNLERSYLIQTIPLGFSFGRKVYGFCETALGMKCLGLCLGIGYRFENEKPR